MTKLSSLISKRMFWVIAITAFSTWQITDEDTYSRMVLRNTRRYLAYELVNWTTNLDDAREVSLKTSKAK
jgi:uncharacterized protein YggT (Ycf19 family)